MKVSCYQCDIDFTLEHSCDSPVTPLKHLYDTLIDLVTRRYDPKVSKVSLSSVPRKCPECLMCYNDRVSVSR